MNPAAELAPTARLRGFWALIVTQFQVAFSDNVLKWLVISLITGMGYSSVKRDQLVGVVGALFALPFILFSMFGGFLADRFSKRSVTIGVKIYEILVMLLALCGLAGHGLYLAIACIFLMEVHSAIFGPSKYGLLPELLPEKKLSWGNGVLELGTFVAIIGGTVVGASLCNTFAGRQVWSGVVLIALAAVGLFASFGISKVPAADPARQFHPNFLTDLWRQIKRIRQDRVLWLATLGNAYFTGLGALLQFLIVIYAKDVLNFSDPRPSSYLQAASGIGIGLGSFAAGYLSGGKIEYGLIPLGSIGMTVLAALLGQHGLSFATVAVEMSLLGFFGGFFIVPIAALLQHRPDKASKGGVLAAANLLSFVGVFAASGVYDLVTVVLHLNPSTVFLLDRCCDARRHRLRPLAPARCRAPLWPLDAHPHTLPRARPRPRQHPRKGRRAVRLQPCFFRGRAPAHRFDGPPGAVCHVRRDLRFALDKALCAHPGRHSHLLRATAARPAARAALRHRGHSRRRRRLHLRRRSNHPHRPVAALSPRHGADHEGRGRAHCPRRAGRRLGQHLQFRKAPFRLETAAAHSLPGHGEFRSAHAAARHRLRGARMPCRNCSPRRGTIAAGTCSPSRAPSCSPPGGIPSVSPWPIPSRRK